MKTTLQLSLALIVNIGVANSQSINEICAMQSMNGVMVDAEMYNGTVYGAGFFTQICGNQVDYIAEWDGTSWVSPGFSLPHDGNSLRTIGNDLYIATYVNAPSDSNWLYRYDGVDLDTVGNGVFLTTASGLSNLANIYDVIEYDGDIYICGEFDRIGGQAISGIARWDGTSWNDVSGGLSGNIQGASPLMFPHQMTVFNGDLYVSGNFENAGGVQVNGIARWDGTSWSAMGSGFNNTVYAVSSYNNELYVGGAFTESNGNTLYRMAKWDGTDWISTGFGFDEVSPFFSFVHTFYEADNGLYIAGGLKQLIFDDGSTANCEGIIYYDGIDVYTLGGGVPNNDIEAVVKDANNQLLVGGGVFGSGYVGIVDQNLSLADQNTEQLKVAPNPAEEYIFVQGVDDLSQVRIYDLTGSEQKVEIDQHENQSVISTTNLSSGMYILSVEDKQLTFVRK